MPEAQWLRSPLPRGLDKAMGRGDHNRNITINNYIFMRSPKIYGLLDLIQNLGGEAHGLSICEPQDATLSNNQESAKQLRQKDNDSAA